VSESEEELSKWEDLKEMGFTPEAIITLWKEHTIMKLQIEELKNERIKANE